MKGARHAMPQMIAEDLLLDLIQGGTNGTDLRQNLDAVAIFFDHARNAAHLAFDTAEPGKLRFLYLFVHILMYTPPGYR